MADLDLISGDRRRSWSRSTERAATILSYFSLDEPRLKVSTLAERLGLHPSSVYRYLEALESAHLIERDEQSGSYKLGLRLVELSAVVLRDLDVRRQALDEMDVLRDKLGMLVNLGVLRDAEVVHVAHAFPPGWPRENMDIGRTAVAQTTSLGKVLLANLAWEDALARVTSAGWRPYTANSIRDVTRLEAELKEVRARGYAIDREENHIGIMCVGVPIRSANNEVSGALSVSGRVENVADRTQELAAELMAVVGRISARIGSSYNISEYL
jgi:IclR family transcriptional regulator, KDG regulon repressor